jgi:hypothetical protein
MDEKVGKSVSSVVLLKLVVLAGCLSSILLVISCRGLVSNAANETVQLNVKISGNGTGTISSNPGGINCGPTCSAFFIVNTQVTLTETPSANSIFAGWQGACSGTSTCVVFLSAGMSVSATFDSKSMPKFATVEIKR